MATDITVGLDPFDRVVRVVLDDETGRRSHVDLDEEEAEAAAVAFDRGTGALQFQDRTSGAIGLLPILEKNAEVAGWLRSAAAALRAHKAGEVDLRLATGKVPKA